MLTLNFLVASAPTVLLAVKSVLKETYANARFKISTMR